MIMIPLGDEKNYRIFSKYYTNSLLVISYMTTYLILKVIQSNNEQKPRDENLLAYMFPYLIRMT